MNGPEHLRRSCAALGLIGSFTLSASALPDAETIQDDPPATHDDYAATSSLRFDLHGRFLHGDIEGFLQTPRGGQAGTTSTNRPAFDELGFDDVEIFDTSLTVQRDQHIFSAGARLIRLDGSATLTDDLISQNVTYPAGSFVTSDVQLDWYRLGYRYEFSFDPGGGNRLLLSPGAEAVMFDFDYQLDGPGELRTDRSYAKGGVRVGGTAKWLTSGRFSLEAGGFWGIPIDGSAEIFSAELVARYRLWGADSQRGAGGSVFLGVAWDEIEYEDDQATPNHINVEMGPLIIVGFEIRF